MNLREIVDLQLDAIFGHTMPPKVQSLINTELNEGRWHEGYDLAVNPSGLTQSEGYKLLETLLSQHPDWRIDPDRLLASVDQKLPQSAFANVLWIAVDDGSFILSDSLRVARYLKETPIWITPRISLDGIKLVAVDEKVVRGLAFLGGDSYAPDSPFTVNFYTGEILEGSVIEY